ncbi:MAG: hypothetical protein R3F46_03655 [bacterium]
MALTVVFVAASCGGGGGTAGLTEQVNQTVSTNTPRSLTAVGPAPS